MSSPPSSVLPSFREAFRFWLKLGFISFGGPAGQIAIMHRELVEQRRWISERHFLHALNFCMLLPGPEAQQLATYLGWRLHGAKGGITAGVLFVVPGMVILYGLSWLYMVGGQLPWLAAIFHGLMASVMAVVADAVLRIGGKALHSPSLWVVAAASFVAIFVFKISFVIIILSAACLGWVGHRIAPRQFPAGRHHDDVDEHEAPSVALPPVPEVGWGRNLRVVAFCLLVWWAPILSSAAWLGWPATLTQQGLFFSRAALVTFGGAYAVLPYVAQQAVDAYGWLSAPQMMAGLALAETTPGPLIMVLQYVGFVGGWQHAGSFSPLVAATLGALMTTWVTFLPCFLFVFLGAPYVERIGQVQRLSAAMTAITAAVVGVILNLGMVFARHAVWPAANQDGRGDMDVFVVILAVAAFIALKRFRAGLIPVIAVCGFAGWVWSFFP